MTVRTVTAGSTNLGEEYIPLAFQYAYEADPEAELYLNDYGMSNPSKRNTYVKIINDLKKRGLRIDAIGMQGHMGMDYPNIEEFEKSMLAFASTGVKLMITEWEMSALPTVHEGANISDTVAFKAAMNLILMHCPIQYPKSGTHV